MKFYGSPKTDGRNRIILSLSNTTSHFSVMSQQPRVYLLFRKKNPEQLYLFPTLSILGLNSNMGKRAKHSFKHFFVNITEGLDMIKVNTSHIGES